MAWREGPRFEPVTGFREPPRFESSSDLQALMLESVMQGCSDTYFQPGAPVVGEKYGRLAALTDRRLTMEECLRIAVLAAGTSGAQTDIAQKREVVCAYSAIDPKLEDLRGEKLRHRFRVNGTRTEFRGDVGMQLVMRSIPYLPPLLETQNFDPKVAEAFMSMRNGIGYVTGATGSGKTTLFGSMSRHVLENDTPIKGNIITLESPIEFVLEDIPSKHSIVAQTEVPRDVDSFGDGTRSSMRRHPALVVVGETRDWETVSAGLEVALTGHPVWTTLHTNDAASIFSRVLSRTPAALRDATLYELISTARVMVNQTLVPTVDGKRTALRETLVLTEDMQNELLAQADPTRITALMRDLVRREGTPMVRAAEQAYQAGLIAQEVLDRFKKREAAHG